MRGLLQALKSQLLDSIFGNIHSIYGLTALLLFPTVSLICKYPDSTSAAALKFFECMGIAFVSQCISVFVTAQIEFYKFLSADTEVEREQMVEEMQKPAFMSIEIGACALSAAPFFACTVYMDGNTLQNMELWQPLATFPSLWFANIFTWMIFRGLVVSPTCSVEPPPQTTTSRENTEPVGHRPHRVTPQPSQSHTQRNQNSPQNNMLQRSNDPTLPLLNPSNPSIMSPTTTYGSFGAPSQSALLPPAYEILETNPQPPAESALAPLMPSHDSLSQLESQLPDGHAEPTEETSQLSNQPQPSIDTTRDSNPIPMPLQLSFSAFFRPPPVSPEYITSEEESQEPRVS